MMKGKHHHFCKSCSKVHPIVGENTPVRRVVLTSSTFADWLNSGHDERETRWLSHWSTIAMRGSTFPELVKAAISELSVLKTSIFLVMGGGVFNSLDQGDSLFDIRCAMHTMVGFLKNHSDRGGDGIRCRVLFAQMFLPPAYETNEEKKLFIHGYNVLAQEFNVLNEFPYVPSIMAIDKVEPRFLEVNGVNAIRLAGQMVDRNAYRERDISRAKHLANKKQFKAMSVILHYFCEAL